MRENETDPLNRRRSIRMPEYDYSTEGGYFITLVTHQREHLFGVVVDGEMRLNEYGKIVREEWLRTKELRPNVEIMEDEFVVMPNHFHGIVRIIETETQRDLGDEAQVVSANSQCKDNGFISELCVGDGCGDYEELVRAYSYTPLPVPARLTSPSKTLGSIVRGFKAAVTTRINTLRSTPGQSIWLRNYYDHIIRSEKDYENVVNYIYLNPLNWDIKDEYYH